MHETEKVVRHNSKHVHTKHKNNRIDLETRIKDSKEIQHRCEVETRSEEYPNIVNTDTENRCDEMPCIEIAPSLDDLGVEMLLSSDSYYSASGFNEEIDEELVSTIDKLEIIDTQAKVCELKEEIVIQEKKYSKLFKLHQYLVRERDTLEAVSKDCANKVKLLQSSVLDLKCEKNVQSQSYSDLSKKHQLTISDREVFKSLTEKYLKQISKGSKIEERLEQDIAQEKDKYSTLEKIYNTIESERDSLIALSEDYTIQTAFLSKVKLDNTRQTEEYDELMKQYESVLSEKDALEASHSNEFSNQVMLLEKDKDKYQDLEHQYEFTSTKNSILEEKVDGFVNEVTRLQVHFADTELTHLKQRKIDKSTILMLKKQIDVFEEASKKTMLNTVIHFFYNVCSPFCNSKHTKATEALQHNNTSSVENHQARGSSSDSVLIKKPTSSNRKVQLLVFSLTHKLLYGFRLRYDIVRKKLIEDELQVEEKREKKYEILTSKEIGTMLKDV